jgi:excisionase family DNA binding protein
MDNGASTLMSIRDAAQATGLSPKALRRRIERGTLTSVMIGGRRRIPMEALARRGLLASGRNPLSVASLGDPAGAAIDAIADRLGRLEARVAALEAAVAPPADVARRRDGDALSRFARAKRMAAASVRAPTGMAPTPDRRTADRRMAIKPADRRVADRAPDRRDAGGQPAGSPTVTVANRRWPPSGSDGGSD